jgi:hypothetical protein
MKKILVTASIMDVVVLAGRAASAGNEALKDQSQTSVISSIVEGKSANVDVQAGYCAADKVSFTDSSLELWSYQYDHATPQAINFVPVLNLLAHGGDVKKKTPPVLLDENGIVKKCTLAESSDVVRGGIAQ